ncbi:MAG: hypothetical protein PWQ49_1265 [Methanohalophilus sp.]|nr:hypothetical protein [Methanohalophilus sp.]
MRLSEFVSKYNLKTEKKPLGLQIHIGDIQDPDFRFLTRLLICKNGQMDLHEKSG